MLKRFLVKILVLLTTLTFFACGGGGGGGSKSNGSGDIGGDTGGDLPRIVYFTVKNPSLEDRLITGPPGDEATRFILDYKVEGLDCTGYCLKLRDWIYPCKGGEGFIHIDPSIGPGHLALPCDNRTCKYIFPDETFKFKFTLIAAEGITADTWVEIYPYRTHLLWLYGYFSDRAKRGTYVTATRWPDGIVNVCDRTNYNRLQDVLGAWNDAIGGAITLVPAQSSCQIIIWHDSHEINPFVFWIDKYKFDTLMVGIPPDIDQKDNDAVYRTYLHVMGHALGFQRHTKNGGVMSEPPGSSEIGEMEKTFMRYLYSLSPGESIYIRSWDIEDGNLRLIGYD
jgi:hypothetical protein